MNPLPVLESRFAEQYITTTSDNLSQIHTFYYWKLVYLFITAKSFDNLNTLGFSLPGCGSGVTEPTSMNPKPMFCSPGIAFPSLSNPAAIPIGFENSLPNNSTFCQIRWIPHH